MNTRTMIALVLLPLSVSGCGEEEVGVVVFGQDRQAVDFSELKDGDDLELLRPQQGGFVAYIGARIQGTSTRVAMKTSLLDPITRTEAAGEERSLNSKPVDDQGTLGADPADTTTFSNLPLCPNYQARDIAGQPYRLDLTVTDLDRGQTYQKSIRVIPRCADTDPVLRALCECECAGSYSAGKCGPQQ